MRNIPHMLLQLARKRLQAYFLRFGLHCATHQVRVILISCVVITSLFYPHFQYTPHHNPNLANLWDGHHSLRVLQDPVSRAKCSTSRALRMERILIQSPLSDDHASHHNILLSTLDLERRLGDALSRSDTPCLKGPTDRCLVLSPLVFWNYDEAAIRSDVNILDTFNRPENVTVAGIPLKPSMVLAGTDFADFLALTYFFPDSDCLSSTEHESWGQLVKSVVKNGNVDIISNQEPTILSLEYAPNESKTKGWTAISTSLYLAYIGFFCYIAWSVRRMDAVHSRLGVTFTALVEIAVSTITSLSVCALVGFKVTMVPWELLPVVIVFVGAENMFNLVDAVGKTSVTLAVKQRIAQGLSRGGTSNTLKVVSYNCILGILAVFTVGAVRQFCTFAIVVLVAHWFLAHTFFLAVLSIDIARLELEELLRHDTSLIPSIPNGHTDSENSKPRSRGHRIVAGTQNLLKGRAAKNISLVMLLAIAATLYYATHTSAIPGPEPMATLGAVARNKTRLAEIVHNHSPAWYIWKYFNPPQAPLLHIRIDFPTVVTFSTERARTGHSVDKNGLRMLIRMLPLIPWLLKIMVLPIAATTAVLWGLLLYLLKDTELLEVQRNRNDHGKKKEGADGLEGLVEFLTLPRTFSSDVEFIAASKDNDVVVSVGLHNEITVWRSESKSHTSIDASDVLLGAASTSFSTSTVTCIGINETGEYIAAGTENASAAVTEIHFVPENKKPRSRRPSYSEPSLFKSGLNDTIALIATYENGVAARTLIAFSLSDGILELVETGDYDPTVLNGCYLQAGSQYDAVAKVHACRTQLRGSMRFVVAAATEEGSVTLWDGVTGECISILEEAHGKVSNIRVSPVLSQTCGFCGQLPLESLSIAFSVDHAVRFYKLFLNDQTHTRRCSCSQSQLHHAPSRESLGSRSRSSSNASHVSSQPSSPLIPIAKLATAFETSFPVSGHGVHSRRDNGRRSSEMLAVPFTGDEYELIMRDGTTTPTGHSFWRNTVVACLADVTCERGGWDVTSTIYFGIRRKPRLQGALKGGTATSMKLGPFEGLSAATLERWELWTFDPASASLRSSLLAALSLAPSRTLTSSSNNYIARLPFTRVSPLLISSSHALAGFGNTIGIFNFSQ
ncbi:sterol-sensing domain of SREBP cleavage-activation-domain-containing protein [Cyathus striatus]|nr:sterol-sensing domain of SREBP cleavage-activation-domain-containing protein [Cyathus striatus]